MGTESLRPPLTGIGNYTLNLLREFQALSDIEATDCFDGDQFLSAEQVLSRFDLPQLPADPGAPPRLLMSQLRSTLRALPLAYSLKSAWSSARFKHGLKYRQNVIYHEPDRKSVV